MVVFYKKQRNSKEEKTFIRKIKYKNIRQAFFYLPDIFSFFKNYKTSIFSFISFRKNITQITAFRISATIKAHQARLRPPIFEKR